MKQVVLFMALLYGSIAVLWADAQGPSLAHGAISPNGKYAVQLKSDERGDLKRAASIHSYDEKSRSYRLLRTIDFEKGEKPNFLFISDDGERIALMNIEKSAPRALVLYGPSGALKAWSLDELLSKDEQKKSNSTGSTIQWFETGEFQSDRWFMLLGPCSGFQGWGSRRIYLNEIAAVRFQIIVDMKTLSLTKNVPNRPRQQP